MVVLAGPGTFGRFECPSTYGYVSVVGAGREQTVFENTTNDFELSTGACHGGITANACSGLNFQDLTAKGARRGVLWIGSGSATWSDVNVVAGNSSASCGTAAGTIAFATTNTGVASSHQFFGSRVIAQANPTAEENAGVELNGPTDVWFYGGDILAQPEVSGSTTQSGVRLTGSSPIMNVFGTSLRVRTGASGSTSFQGVRLTSATAQFRMHGGIINTDASGTATITAYGVRNSPPAGFVNTNGTAFEVKAGGSGQAFRLAGNSAGFQSPYLWPPGNTPPNMAAATASNGQDLWVNTDGGESHLMAYDIGCNVTGMPWRDQLTGACMP